MTIIQTILQDNTIVIGILVMEQNKRIMIGAIKALQIVKDLVQENIVKPEEVSIVVLILVKALLKENQSVVKANQTV